MLQDYGVWQQKSFLGKKYMGVARSTFLIGPEGTIETIFPNVRPGKHAEEVLATLD